MHISEEQYLKIRWLRGYSYESNLLSFFEELGELSTEIAISKGYKNREPSEDGVLGESIDCLICIIALTSFGDSNYSDLIPSHCRNRLGEGYQNSSETSLLRLISNVDYNCRLAISPCVAIFLRYGGNQAIFDKIIEAKLEKWNENLRKITRTS